MKKVLSILVVVCMLFSCMSFAQAADYALAIKNNVAMMVGNSNAIAYNSIMTVSVAPMEENGEMLVPAGFVVGGFGGSIDYNSNNGLVTITLGSKRTAQLVIGVNYATVNGRVYYTEVAPKIVDGQIMVPVTFLGETVLGKAVYYDAAYKMAVITQTKCLSSRDKEAVGTIASALTTGVLPELIVKVPVEEVSGSLGGVNAETGKLTIVSATTDNEPQPENSVWASFDGSLESRWASQGAGSAIYDLGEVKPVTNVKIACWKPNERNTNYSIEVSDNGGRYSEIYNGASSGSQWDSYTVNQSIRYIKVNTNGSSAGDWASILEIEVWNGEKITTPTTGGTGAVAGSVVVSPSGTKLSLSTSMVQVSAEPQPENNKGNMFDGNKQTVWASEGVANAVIDLGSVQTVSTVGVAMKMYDDMRVIPFDIEISTDGTSYSNVWSGESDPQTDATKYISVGSAARYVRITGHGNTTSGWNSVAEVEIYSSGAATGVTTTTNNNTTAETSDSATGTKLSLSSSMVEVSAEPQPENNKGNMFDGNKQTVWAAEGVANAVIDLGEAKNISTVGVAMKMYDDMRTIPYDVEVSTDGTSYTNVWSGQSEPQTDATNYITTDVKARYVRITAHGNTTSGWNSVAEIEIYTK